MLNFRRPLGLVEHLFATFHGMGAMIYVNIARIQGVVAGDLLRTAIDLLQQRHPLLQVHLQESDGNFYFCTESTLPIPLGIIDRQHDRQWTEIAEDELSRKFTGEFEPLCRITLLQSSDRLDSQELIVTFHHAIADGLSALHFMHELMSVYQQLVAGTPVLPMESLPLLPPLEQLLAQYLSEPAANLIQVPPSQTNPSPVLLIEQAAPVDRRRTRLLPCEFGRDLTLQLKSRCREERTTVHGALCAAMLLVCMRQLSSPESVVMSCGSSVNLRGSCLPLVERDHLGCFVSAVTTSHQISIDANFWELARECQTTIHQLIDDKFPHYQVSNPDLISKYQPSFLAQLAEHNMGRTTTAHISNLGQFDFTKSSESVRLESFYFATGQNLVGTCFWLGAVTIDQRLFCTFAYVDPLISPNTAKSLVNSTIAILTNVSSG